jgi:hypothetical protein
MNFMSEWSFQELQVMAGRQKRPSGGAKAAGDAQGRDNPGREGRHVPVNFTTRSFLRFCAARCQ